MSRPAPHLLLVLVSTLLLVACGQDQPASTAAADSASGETTAEPAVAEQAPAEITVTHVQGEAAVPVNPATVVTFELGALDTLDVLGVDVAGLPDATLPERLAHHEGTPTVGSLFEPDYEAVNALAPDLIIVGGRSAEAYRRLSEIAPTIDLTVDNRDFLASFTGHLETIGAIFGGEERIAEEIAALEGRITDVAEAGAQAGTGLIVLTTGGELSAYGPGSRFGIIHDVLGVQPAVEGLSDSTHGDAISFEFVLEANPDHLFVLDRDAAIGESGTAAQALLDNEIVARTTAWREGQVTYLDGTDWYLVPTGLRSVGNMVDAIEAAVS